MYRPNGKSADTDDLSIGYGPAVGVPESRVRVKNQGAGFIGELD
jgi:hypothetical protein